MIRFWLISGSIFACLSVIVGAFGAHTLKSILSDYGRDIFQTAVQYQMYHALALIMIGVLQKYWPELSLNICGWSFLIGILLFSGSLYIISIYPLKIIGPLTPIGGA